MHTQRKAQSRPRPRGWSPLVIADGTITAIVEHPRMPGRVEVIIDDATKATIADTEVVALGLRIGTRVDGALAARLADEAAFTATFDRGARMLASRSRSISDLRRRLARDGPPAPIVDRAIEQLERAGFLDDGAFARQFTRAKATNGAMAPFRIRQELGRLGVARDVIDESLATVTHEEGIDAGSAEQLDTLAQKRMRSLARLAPEVGRRRLYAFLARRGYAPGDVRDAVARAFAASTDSGDE